MSRARLTNWPRRASSALLVSGLLVAASACGSQQADHIPGNARPGISAQVSPPITTAEPHVASPTIAAAPYLYLGADAVPDPRTIMAATGIRWFTVAFVLARGLCDPQWDGVRPLLGGSDQRTIEAIRGVGGDVIVSFGGQNGPWLERSCTTAAQLAAAYQRVIDAYGLRAIDIDIEGSLFVNPIVQQRVVDALKIVRAANAGLTISVTFPIETSGPDPGMINRAASSGLVVDCWAAMPFDLDAAGQNMSALTERLIDQLATVVQDAYRYSVDQAFRHVGISSMNGITDSHETVTETDFQAMLDFAQRRHLARFTFWSANRDRSCDPGVTASDTCSGVPQASWDFTRIVAQYHG
jgi:hypothetical protein